MLDRVGQRDVRQGCHPSRAIRIFCQDLSLRLVHQCQECTRLGGIPGPIDDSGSVRIQVICEIDDDVGEISWTVDVLNVATMVLSMVIQSVAMVSGILKATIIYVFDVQILGVG